MNAQYFIWSTPVLPEFGSTRVTSGACNDAGQTLNHAAALCTPPSKDPIRALNLVRLNTHGNAADTPGIRAPRTQIAWRARSRRRRQSAPHVCAIRQAL